MAFTNDGKVSYEGRTIHKVLHDRYAKWWPIIKRRNVESQEFNRILIGDAKDDGVWNNNICPSKIARAIVKQHLPSIPDLVFHQKGDRCFCVKCHKERGDKVIYSRGKPPKQHALPVGWVRLGLKTDEAKCVMNKVWDEWHVAFHGTTKEVIPLTFKSGCVLLKPGDHTLNGDQLGIRSGHIPRSFERINKFTKRKEMFDPNQIYVSPSMQYSGHPAYAKPFLCSHPQDKTRTIKIQFAF